MVAGLDIGRNTEWYIQVPRAWGRVISIFGKEPNILSSKWAREVSKENWSNGQGLAWGVRRMLTSHFLTQRYEMCGWMSNISLRHAVVVPQDSTFQLKQEVEKCHKRNFKRDLFICLFVYHIMGISQSIIERCENARRVWG